MNPLSLYLSQTLYMSVGCLKNGLTQLVKEDLEEGSVWNRGTGFISIIGKKTKTIHLLLSTCLFDYLIFSLACRDFKCFPPSLHKKKKEPVEYSKEDRGRRGR